MIINKGYHTLEDRGNASEIESSGPIRAKKLNIAWLGLGFYFWDTKAAWAHVWGQRNYPNNYLIFEAKIIRDDRVFDLFGDVEHITEFLECAKIIKTKNAAVGRHVVYVPEVVEYIKKVSKKFTNLYTAIRCADYPDAPQVIAFRQDKPEKMYIGGERVQYCLFNYNNIIKDSFQLFFPENL